MARSRWTFGLAVLMVSLVAGCAGLPFAKLERLDSRQVEYAKINKVSPVVVFENGLAADMGSWNKVFSEIGSEAASLPKQKKPDSKCCEHQHMKARSLC